MTNELIVIIISVTMRRYNYLQVVNLRARSFVIIKCSSPDQW